MAEPGGAPDRAAVEAIVEKILAAKKLAGPEQIAEAKKTSAGHPQKPPILAVLVKRGVITKEVAAKVGAAARKKAAEAGAGAAPAPAAGGGGGFGFEEDSGTAPVSLPPGLSEPAADEPPKRKRKKPARGKASDAPAVDADFTAGVNLDDLPSRPEAIGSDAKLRKVIVPLLAVIAVVIAVVVLTGGEDEGPNGTRGGGEDADVEDGDDDVAATGGVMAPGLKTGDEVHVRGSLFFVDLRSGRAKVKVGDDICEIYLVDQPRFLEGIDHNRKLFTGSFVQFTGILDLDGDEDFTLDDGELVHELLFDEPFEYNIIAAADAPADVDGNPLPDDLIAILWPDDEPGDHGEPGDGDDPDVTGDPDDPDAEQSVWERLSSHQVEAIREWWDSTTELLATAGENHVLPDVQAWHNHVRALRRFTNDQELGLVEMAADWLRENPPVARSEFGGSADNAEKEVWFLVMRLIERIPGREIYGPRLVPIYKQAYVLYPDHVIDAMLLIGGSARDLLEYAPILYQGDAGLTDEEAARIGLRRENLLRQLETGLADDDFAKLVPKLLDAPDQAVAIRALGWVVRHDVVPYLPTVAEWFVSGDARLRNAAQNVFYELRRSDDEAARSAAVTELLKHVGPVNGAIRSDVLAEAIGISPQQCIPAIRELVKADGVENAAEVATNFDKVWENPVELFRFAKEIFDDTATSGGFSAWANGYMRRFATASDDPEIRNAFIDSTLRVLERGPAGDDAYAGLAELIAGRTDLWERIFALFEDDDRGDQAPLIGVLVAADADKGLQLAADVAVSLSRPGPVRLAALDALVKSDADALVERVIDQVRGQLGRPNFPPELALVINKLALEAQLQEAKGRGFGDMEEVAILADACVGSVRQHTVAGMSERGAIYARTAENGYDMDVRIVTRNGIEQRSILRRTLRRAWNAYENERQHYAVDPSRLKPQQPQGVQPADDLIVDIQVTGTTVRIITVRGNVESYDVRATYDHGDFTPDHDEALIYCQSTTSFWAANGLGRGQTADFTIDFLVQRNGSPIAVLPIPANDIIYFVNTAAKEPAVVSTMTIRESIGADIFTVCRVSPDGKKALFISQPVNSPHPQVFVAELSRTADVELVMEKAPADNHVYWADDGDHLFVVTEDGIRVMNLRSGDFVEDTPILPTLKTGDDYRISVVEEGDYIVETNGKSVNVRRMDGVTGWKEVVASFLLPAEVYDISVLAGGKRICFLLASREVACYEID
jgi:hypothetical protein